MLSIIKAKKGPYHFMMRPVFLLALSFGVNSLSHAKTLIFHYLGIAKGMLSKVENNQISIKKYLATVYTNSNTVITDLPARAAG